MTTTIYQTNYFFRHDEIIDDDEFFKAHSNHEKKTLNYNNKGRSTHRAKNLQMKINLHFLQEMKSNEIKNNIF